MRDRIVVVYQSENNDLGNTLQILKKSLKDRKCEFISRDNLLERDTRNALVIVAGGDGTFLSSSHRILDGFSVVLGVRLRETSVGAHLTCDLKDIQKALRVIDSGVEGNDYRVERRERLECVMHTGEGNYVRTALALNEFFIGNTCAYYPARYSIHIDGTEEYQTSSGILACTKHGYTGWTKWSNYGKALDWNGHKCFFVRIREPMGEIYNQNLFTTDSINIESDMHRGMVVPDSYDEYHFNRGTRVEVRLSNNPLNVITFPEGKL